MTKEQYEQLIIELHRGNITLEYFFLMTINPLGIKANNL